MIDCSKSTKDIQSPPCGANIKPLKDKNNFDDVEATKHEVHTDQKSNTKGSNDLDDYFATAHVQAKKLEYSDLLECEILPS